MSKGKSFISEIGKFFKENDATSAMNQIMDITRMLNLSEKRLFGEESRCNCKYSQLQVLQLLLLFPCFMIKNAFNYSRKPTASIPCVGLWKSCSRIAKAILGLASIRCATLLPRLHVPQSLPCSTTYLPRQDDSLPMRL